MSAAGTSKASEPSGPTPDPLREVPRADQFCDLVLNGGVASGVVYPWALLELARHYRFKNIGGNSVGAMAAAMAAAAEYGRCNGVENAFEPLRRFPLELAKDDGHGNTKMLRLFQPSPQVRRLFDVFLALVRWSSPEPDPKAAMQAQTKTANTQATSAATGSMASDAKKDDPPFWPLLASVLSIYGVWRTFVVLLLPAGWVTYLVRDQGAVAVVCVVLLAFLGSASATLLISACRVRRDLHALADNRYGLCTGLGQMPGEEGLVEWLHRGIQLSAGREREDPPLTFADLWAAPRFGAAGPGPLPDGLQPDDPGINLQMFASNVTLGRPIRLPLNDANTRLYYHPEEWRSYFPRAVMDALELASRPYMPASRSDPDPANTKAPLDPKQTKLLSALRELPSGGMPIVVAARLSLCFPLLFSCVPVYAVDYEAPQNPDAQADKTQLPEQRRLRQCLLSDGGLCTNFPIHLFDAAHPKWPTFGLQLDNRLQKYKGEALWLPETHLEGRSDNWQRFVPGAENEGTPERSLLGRMLGVATGMLFTMKDWNDRMTARLPQVRNRIVRLALQDGEGQLNLAMPARTILRMAHQYGTNAGKELVRCFAPDNNGAKPAWKEHIYVRSMIELRALRQHVRSYTAGLQARGSSLPMHEILDQATKNRPLALRGDRADPYAAPLTATQRQALDRAIVAIQRLETELSVSEEQFGPYRPVLEPELRLRPPL